MKIIDISWPITEDVTGYKDKKTVQFEHVKTFEDDKVRESKIIIGSHTGTHIDAPPHFLSDGQTIDQIALDHFIGACKVLDLTHVTESITSNDLEQFLIEPGEILLFKTKNSLLSPTQKFNYEFIYLRKDAAQYLAQKKIKTVGIDYLGIERAQPDHETHKAFLQNGIPIIEGLRLAQVKPGEYMLCCLPIFTVGLEAAPARAVLLRD